HAHDSARLVQRPQTAGQGTGHQSRRGPARRLVRRVAGGIARKLDGRRARAAGENRGTPRRQPASESLVVIDATICSALNGAVLLAAAANDGKQLPPPTRAAVQMALIAFALVVLLFVVMVLLGGHWVRRQGSPRRGPVVPPDRAPLRGDSP